MTGWLSELELLRRLAPRENFSFHCSPSFCDSSQTGSQFTQQGRNGTVTTSARVGAGREARRLGIGGRLNPETGEGATGDEGPSWFTRQETNWGVSLAGEWDVPGCLGWKGSKIHDSPHLSHATEDDRLRHSLWEVSTTPSTKSLFDDASTGVGLDFW